MAGISPEDIECFTPVGIVAHSGSKWLDETKVAVMGVTTHKGGAKRRDKVRDIGQVAALNGMNASCLTVGDMKYSC